MTDDVRCLLRSSECLKDQLAMYFGYTFAHNSDWCCSAKVSLKSFDCTIQEDIAGEETGERVFALPSVQSKSAGRDAVIKASEVWSLEVIENQLDMKESAEELILYSDFLSV